MPTRTHTAQHPGWLVGAINGLALGFVAELLLRLLYQYERYGAGESLQSDVVIDTAPYPFSWWYLPALFLVLTTLASAIAYRFLVAYLNSQPLLWAAIGGLVVVELYLITASIDWWNALRSPQGVDFWQFAHSNKLFPWVLLMPGVIVFNALFGWLLAMFFSNTSRD